MNGEIISITTLEKINQLKKENKKLNENKNKVLNILPKLYKQNKIDIEVWNLLENMLK